jgi:hypothetical protein
MYIDNFNGIVISDRNLADVPRTFQSLVSFQYIYPTGLFVRGISLFDSSLLLFDGFGFPFPYDVVTPYLPVEVL